MHAFVDDPARVLVLGGVEFPGERGLAGHSDADAIAHAAADALLGAAGLGDIGRHFPDTDPRWEGADSIGLLAESARRVRAAGWAPVNVDCAVVCERPKLSPRRDEMEARLTDAVGAPVTVGGNRAEGLGAIGRNEGLAVYAVALVAQVPDDEPAGQQADQQADQQGDQQGDQQADEPDDGAADDATGDHG